jgi:uncharacterized protein (DUF924 family)
MFEQILNFWFVETKPEQRWKVDPAFDETIRRRFAEIHGAANLGELWQWRAHARGRLAEVIILDQFSRNMFRGTGRAFASDALALVLSQVAVAVGHDKALPPEERVFLYMPFEHSESRLVHVEALRLFGSLGLPDFYEYELRHKAIVDRFGRYPHRNEALGRPSTPAELEFLAQPGSRF